LAAVEEGLQAGRARREAGRPLQALADLAGSAAPPAAFPAVKHLEEVQGREWACLAAGEVRARRQARGRPPKEHRRLVRQAEGVDHPAARLGVEALAARRVATEPRHPPGREGPLAAGAVTSAPKPE